MFIIFQKTKKSFFLSGRKLLSCIFIYLLKFLSFSSQMELNGLKFLLVCVFPSDSASWLMRRCSCVPCSFWNTLARGRQCIDRTNGSSSDYATRPPDVFDVSNVPTPTHKHIQYPRHKHSDTCVIYVYAHTMTWDPYVHHLFHVGKCHREPTSSPQFNGECERRQSHVIIIFFLHSHLVGTDSDNFLFFFLFFWICQTLGLTRKTSKFSAPSRLVNLLIFFNYPKNVIFHKISLTVKHFIKKKIFLFSIIFFLYLIS